MSPVDTRQHPQYRFLLHHKTAISRPYMFYVQYTICIVNLCNYAIFRYWLVSCLNIEYVN